MRHDQSAISQPDERDEETDACSDRTPHTGADGIDHRFAHAQHRKVRQTTPEMKTMPSATRQGSGTPAAPSDMITETKKKFSPINTYLARTHTPGLRDNASSYRVQLEYNADRYGIILENMMVGKDFNPETGYVRRTDVRRDLADLRFSPRPRSSRIVRKYDYSGSIDQFTSLTDAGWIREWSKARSGSNSRAAIS